MAEEGKLNEERRRAFYVGNTFSLWINQAWRQTTALAILGDKMLLEYEMPNMSSSLRIVGLEQSTDSMTVDYRNVGYGRLPKKWLRAVCQGGESWIGMPQQSSGWYSQPRRLWRERYGDESWL